MNRSHWPTQVEPANGDLLLLAGTQWRTHTSAIAVKSDGHFDEDKRLTLGACNGDEDAVCLLNL